MRDWLTYLLRCSDGSIYCGVTNDLCRRLKAHNAGKGAKYTRAHLPVELLNARFNLTKSEAMRLEAVIKKAPRERKMMMLWSQISR